MFMQPRFILLKEGTDTSQGKGQCISNINAVQAIAEIVKTTLGPRGMDKLIHDGSSVTITNDGATIISLLDIVHPSAHTLVDIAKSQDSEVGDGTTTVCLLASEFLKNVKPFIEEGMHPRVIVKGYRLACELALDQLKKLAIPIDKKDETKFRDMLLRCAGTALNSKLICTQKDFFSKMVVDAVMYLDDPYDLNMVGMKRVAGGSVTDSYLVPGIAFKKTFSYAGFEQQPKTFANPKIVCLNVELELKSEGANAEVRIDDITKYQSIVDAEWKIIYDKLDAIYKSGAKVVLSRLPIGDLATQYFADRDVFCAGRVPQEDMERVAAAMGATIQTSLSDLNSTVLGECKKFEEKQVGSERFNFFTGCPKLKATTIILRGGADQFIAEAERSVHDSMMIVKRAMKHTLIVGGGGAIEMELSKYLREYSKTIKSKIQLIVAAFAKSLEVIPHTLSENAGFDATDIVNEMRALHARENKSGLWMGVDIEKGGCCDMIKSFVWEPSLVKHNALSSATEAACVILSVDETIRNPKAENLSDRRPARGRGMRG
eukprot:TRINITY_DN1830_c0_g1_i1.p1 TRINITY_DN1830_c0_g1~~TRINITY_DN1830_c0_g1_i1.p1  ORF type:complete len:545 (+),score=129.93 TRINITY_DN1830_c0_g1_i1:145-1779(+)